MTRSKTPGNGATYCIVSAALVAMSSASFADNLPFRVAFEDVPGVDEITSGNTGGGIRILKQQLDSDDTEKGLILATLCGAYIMEMSLEEATQICTDAVDQYPGETAFNNRGVLRVFMGDFKGAHEDFDRARPARMDEYLEDLMTRDVGLIADGNHSLLEALQAKHSPGDVTTSVAVNSGIKIEDMHK